MKLIEDLGLQYPTNSSKQKVLFAIYECPKCSIHIRCQVAKVANGTATKCRACANKDTNRLKSDKAAESFIVKACSIHGNRYDYSEATYINSRTIVSILCKEHGVFSVTPNSHLNNRGCPECSSASGFNKTKSAILYYLKVTYNDTTVYKIGITNRTVCERFSVTDLRKIQVLKTWEFTLGADAYIEEQDILKDYQEFRYTGEPLLKNGNTELFTKDILGLALSLGGELLD